MSLVVVNYPTVSREDFDWMQSIRAEHDGLYYEHDRVTTIERVPLGVS